MILDVQGLTKVFRNRKSEFYANDNINFSIKEGEIYGLLGHNGAGKTTLVNQILGSTKPTSGDVFLLGESVQKNPLRARSLCSVQPQSQLPLGFLTPTQAVSTMGKMRLGNKHDVKKRMDMLFEMLDIGAWVNTEGVKLSGGIRRLTSFCMAVIQPGKLVVLDEPTNDVDPIRRRYLWDVIRELTKDGTSVILVTHNVLEAEKAVDRVAILHKGKFLTQGSPAEVKSSVSNQIRLEVGLLKESTEYEVPAWAQSSNFHAGRMFLSLSPDYAPAAIEWARDHVEQGKVIDYTLSPTTLEDVYVELTGGRGTEEGAGAVNLHAGKEGAAV
ncbi:multidrug ABC transporter ATP-binding protein [Tumebacillus algifaecis]|uniref:Multidrug ABC transporter ATP-binding protein n=1 Tax=Tumebacillus algifaecis TaxID=1214604 RepID=A0A223CXH3_9BACL|nr:ABC transporter ATP-binding protein [Tumebacillus algifaecis]ASS74008.1 multidrug ABC transporter ATP-binding protein [Tumebacillus algifaecis]